jgi:acetyltransferase-like isoleucine patch superfamily enzyme
MSRFIRRDSAVGRLASRAIWFLESQLGQSDLMRLKAKGRVTIGEGSYGEPSLFDYGMDSTRVVIGNYTSMARDCVFLLGGNHRIDTVTTFPLRIQLGLPGAGEDGQPWSKGDIVIGSDVWIGARAIILSGVTVGHGAVIAAGSVISKDVRPYSIVVGNPGKELKRRFSDEHCPALLDIAWWNWSREDIVAAAPDLADDAIEDFIQRHQRDRPRA